MTPDEFRKSRQRLGLTQAELAAWLDVGVRTLKGWEAGRSPVPRAVELALAYRTFLDILYSSQV